MTRDAFRTADGRAVPAVTADEMREVDRIAVEEVGFSLLGMMENAGRHLAETVRSLDRGPVTVYAGGGGNGGGGLAAARHLANRDATVDVVLDRDPADLDGAAADQLRVLRAMDVPIGVEPEREAALLVDALVGYGLTGELRGLAADLVASIEGRSAPVVSLDVPSGRDATTGETPGPAVEPDVTLTLALPKTGLEGLSGRLLLADIGIPAVVFERAGIDYTSPFEDGTVELHA